MTPTERRAAELQIEAKRRKQIPEMEAIFREEGLPPAKVVRPNFQATPEHPGSMSDFARMTEPNPDRWPARIPIDAGLAYATGGASTALSGGKALSSAFPILAKFLGYAGKSLTAPSSVGQMALGGGLEGVINESIQPDATLGSVAQAAGIGSASPRPGGEPNYRWSDRTGGAAG